MGRDIWQAIKKILNPPSSGIHTESDVSIVLPCRMRCKSRSVWKVTTHQFDTVAFEHPWKYKKLSCFMPNRCRTACSKSHRDKAGLTLKSHDQLWTPRQEPRSERWRAREHTQAHSGHAQLGCVVTYSQGCWPDKFAKQSGWVSIVCDTALLLLYSHPRGAIL